MFECIWLFEIFIASLCYSVDVANATIMRSFVDSEEKTRRTRIVSTVRSTEMTTLKVPHPTQPRSTYYAWLKIEMLVLYLFVVITL